MNTVALELPSDVFSATRMSKSELKIELAVHLYAENKLTLGKAAKLAEMDTRQFMHLLASRQILAHYDIEEYEEDLSTLRRLSRI